ncbi:MAG: LPS export ABC transporter periplasmic protein LptC [Gammaproteobacteria bacterium]|nr:LPS export ABC transporter periplasmic protein LptC [Gammaproteobacteria bacterium]
MKAGQKRFAQLMLAAGLATIAWWAMDNQIGTHDAPSLSSANLPDYTIDNFSATRLNANGTPRHQLSADHYRYFAVNDSAELVRPHLVQYSQGNAPTHTRADTGTLNPKQKSIVMRGNVEVRQGKQTERGPIQLRTNELTVELQ